MPAVAPARSALHAALALLFAVALAAAGLWASTANAATHEPPEPVDASFTASPTSGTVPLKVDFTDDSRCEDYEYYDCSLSWEWDFDGDGAVDSVERNPTFTYQTPGTRTATLKVSASFDYPRKVGAAALSCEEEASLCDTASVIITASPKPEPKPTTAPPSESPEENDDSDDNDDSEENDDSDDNDGVVTPVRPGGTPGATPTTEPTPTEPTDTPTEAPIEQPIEEPIPDPKPASSRYSGPVAPVVALMILAAVIGSLGRVGGLAMAGRQAALVADRDENTVQRHVAARDAEGWGDRSFTWRFPGHALIDAASVVLPDRFARFSPLAGRITEDGSEFRAMFGSLWLATPLAGMAVGIAGASAAGGQAMPPSVWLLAAGAVLATFDAFSGALAVAVFSLAALVGDKAGGPDFVHSLLVLLAIGFLWMAIPLIGSAIRPFRRLGDGSLRHRWDVAADGLIAALLCGWVAQKLVAAMDLFAGQPTGLPEHANTVAIVVMAAVALRVTMEHFSMSAYPKRLQQVEGEDPPPPLLLSSILGAFVRTAIFGFIGYAFIGSCWQLWLGIGLFLVPQLIEHIRESFPNFGVIRRILPRGVVEIFILVVACTLAARFAMSQSPDQFSGLRLAFLLIAIPPALIGALAMLAEDDNADKDTTWPREFLGAIIVAVTAVLASRGWDY